MNAVSENAVSILIVDDQPMVRLGVRRAITTQADMAICCETDTMEAALVIVRTSKVDLVIAELSLGTDDGLELIRRLRQIRQDLPILVYSRYDIERFAQLAFKAGADGFVMKRETPDHLIHAIRELLAGRQYTGQRLPPNPT
jgi:DNA-binding NarL/FixJ family response regulator